MEFKKYIHLERFGTTEVLNIEQGKIHIFPKIDGTNASLWCECDGLYTVELQAGSRNRKLHIDNDNAGFFNWAVKQKNIERFFTENPHLRLYGEWLVPHSLKTYREDAWRNFYVFDVCEDNGDGEMTYIPFERYEPILKKYNIEYIPPIAIVENCTYDKLIEYLNSNNYLIKDGEGAGEGIVIKNYDFVNKYGRVIWAKIVTSEFREKHTKEMGASQFAMKPPVEQEIIDTYLTQAVVDKVYDKITVANDGWSTKFIPQLLNTVYYDLVREECWNFVKKFKNPTINYSILQHIAFNKVKQLRTDIF